MPVIRISDSTFRALQDMAIPLVDTPGTVIDRLVAEQLVRDGKGDAVSANRYKGQRSFDPSNPPGLTHTQMLSGSVDGNELPRARWSALLMSVIDAVRRRGHTGKALAAELNVAARTGEHSDQGFKHYPALGLSIQGQSAHDAWREIVRLALKHDINVGVTFRWRDKPGADYPGCEGAMTIGAPV